MKGLIKNRGSQIELERLLSERSDAHYKGLSTKLLSNENHLLIANYSCQGGVPGSWRLLCGGYSGAKVTFAGAEEASS